MCLTGCSRRSSEHTEAASTGAADCTTGSGTGAAAGCCPTFTIRSRTVATQPSDRARTTVGIGEEVRLSTDPSQSVRWTIVDDDGAKGTLSAASGASTTYTAHDRAASLTVRAESSCHTATLALRVVQPGSGTLESPVDLSVMTATTAQVGFRAVHHVQPANVSFLNCEFKEGTCAATASGVLSGKNGEVHAPTASWIPFTSTVTGRGTALDGDDTVRTGTYPFTMFPAGGTTDGRFDWPIPWRIQVRGGGVSGAFVFDTLTHVESYTAATRVLRIDKGGQTQQRTIP